MPTVLIVEDDAAHMRLAAMLLAKAGYAVVEAPDADIGLRLARERLPDLILMDVKLPGMDGLEATRIIKASPELSAIPVIIVSSYIGENPAVVAAAAGAAGFMLKPYHYKEFLAAVANALANATRAKP